MANVTVRASLFRVARPFHQAELPTKPFTVVKMKGSTLAQAVKHSRAGDLERPGFLHLDDGCLADDEHQLTTVNRQPLIEEQEYQVRSGFGACIRLSQTRR